MRPLNIDGQCVAARNDVIEADCAALGRQKLESRVAFVDSARIGDEFQGGIDRPNVFRHLVGGPLVFDGGGVEGVALSLVGHLAQHPVMSPGQL